MTSSVAELGEREPAVFVRGTISGVANPHAIKRVLLRSGNLEPRFATGEK